MIGALGEKLMSGNDPSIITDAAEAAFMPEVDETYSNTYYLTATDFDIRIAFGTIKTSPNGANSVNHMKTAVHLNYMLAKDLVKNMETMIERYEAVYGPADIVIR
jgi:protein subunit release factor A